MLSPELTQQLTQALQGLTYGSIQLIVHDSQVVRIERIERVRLSVSAQALTEDKVRQPTDSPEVYHEHPGR